jgi:high affinity Mn2+ porin
MRNFEHPSPGADGVHITADYQFVDNPGYNLARGLVSLFALRLHAEF